MIEETVLTRYVKLRQNNGFRLCTVAAQAQQLVEYAERLGVVLTISTSPQQPLAMGNYKMRTKVRLARPQYQEEMALKAEVDATAGQS